MGATITPFGVYYAWRFAKESEMKNDGDDTNSLPRKAGPLLTLWVFFLGVVMFLILCLLVFSWMGR